MPADAVNLYNRGVSTTPAEAPVKAALFDAALDVIKERGPQKLSLREVARRAGVSHAAPYNHFANKHALLVALAAEGFRRLDQSMADAQAIASPRPDEQLTAIGLGYVMFALRNQELYRLMQDSELCPRDDVLDALRTTDATNERLFDCVVALRTAHGQPLDDMSVRVDALILWSLVHGLSDLLNNDLVDGVDKTDMGFFRGLLRRSLSLYDPDPAGST